MVFLWFSSGPGKSHESTTPRHRILGINLGTAKRGLDAFFFGGIYNPVPGSLVADYIYIYNHTNLYIIYN